MESYFHSGRKSFRWKLLKWVVFFLDLALAWKEGVVDPLSFPDPCSTINIYKVIPSHRGQKKSSPLQLTCDVTAHLNQISIRNKSIF